MKRILTFVVLSVCLSALCGALTQNTVYSSDTYENPSMLASEGQSVLPSAEDKITIGDALAVICRGYAVAKGVESAENESFDVLCEYVKLHGDFDGFSFGDKDRYIFRYELAQLIAGLFDEQYFEKINSISSLPDVDCDEAYSSDVLMLYNAGLFTGIDGYGTFCANDLVTYGEFFSVMERLAVEEKRKKLSLDDYGDREMAAYLIDDKNMLRTVRNVSYIASGWKYENPSVTIGKKTDYSTNVLTDISSFDKVTIRKEVVTTDNGSLGFECLYNTSGNGSRVYFEDLDGDLLFEVSHENGKFFVTGKNKNSTGYAFASGNVRLCAQIDLDRRLVRIVINNTDCGLYSLGSASDLSRVCISTTDEDVLNISVSSVFLYRNYRVADTFRTYIADEVPYDWDAAGDVSVVVQNSDMDKYNMRIVGEGGAEKSFYSLTDRLVFSAYVRVTENQKVRAVLSGGSDSFTINAENGVFTTDKGALRAYTDGVWQQIRIEADTNKGKATVKINGKDCGEFDFDMSFVDTVTFLTEGEGVFEFDDVYVYNVYDYVDYCPEPVPVNDDEWYSCMSICSLWREGTHYGWDCISPYEDLTPVTGYYDEGIPESMDWEIKFMAEHGYDYQRFCWYYGGHNENIKKPRLCDAAIHEGYFNARYSHMLDFSLMWENAGSKGTKDEFYNNIWPYWVDWYFTDDRYFCIDNKPVLTIYSYNSFIEIMGGNDGAKECIDFMESELKKLGFDGMILYASNAGANADTNEMLSLIGFDSKAAYHFDEPAYNIDYQKLRMEAETEAGGIHFTPSCGIGFNDIGWTETRTPLASAEDFEEILRWSRDVYLKSYEEQGITDWRAKSVMTNTWNEFGEGHYVFPTSLNGFGYMDAHRHVFSSVADTDDSQHYDVYPTINQKKRLGFLYTTRNIPLRKLQYDDGLEDDSKIYVPVKEWDFEKPSDCYMWGALAKTTDPVYDENEKALVGATTTNDGHIKMMEFKENRFDADECDYLHVKMKIMNPAATMCSFYFKNEGDLQWTAQRGDDFQIIADGNYHDYYVNLKTLTTWTGEIAELRFDPLNVAGEYAIKKIEFLQLDRTDCFRFNVDTDEFVFNEHEYLLSDDGVYVYANPTSGFYSANLLYYEWNRWDEKLFIRSAGGTEFEFTVGSNKALVNGEWKEFDIAVSMYDGLPLLPITFIYENSGHSYKRDGKKIEISLRSDDSSLIISSRVPNEYEFNLAGDNEGWSISGALGGVSDGCLTVVSTHNGIRYDPQLTKIKQLIDSKIYTTATVRVKPEFYTQSSTDTSFSFFFTTSDDSTWNESKRVSQYSVNYKPDEEGFYTLNFDFTENPHWKSNVLQIRFDPPNREGKYIIDYIRLNADEEYLEQLEKDKLQQMQLEEKLSIADKGGAFHIENGDGEGEYNVSKYSRNGNIDVSIVNDELIDGNKALLVKNKNTDKMTWSYIDIPTRYKPGVTYTVEFDIRLVSDCHGNTDVSSDFSPNFRYADVIGGATKSMADHAVASKPVYTISSSDGWVHCYVTHTVSALSPSRTNDFFSLYVSPSEKDGVIYNYSYMLDNIKAYVTDNYYSFRKNGDSEGWQYYGSTGSVSGGFSVFTSKLTGTYYDPHMYKSGLEIDADKYKVVRVRFKPEFYDSQTETDFGIYFATDTETKLSESKTVRVDCASLKPDSEGFYVMDFDMSKNGLWDGTVNILRFDPPNRSGKFTVDYIYVDVE